MGDRIKTYRLSDRRPQVRDDEGTWRPWHPHPLLSPLDPVLQWFAERMTCRHCAAKIPYATIVAAIQRGKWAQYCSARHRENARKRRQRVKPP